LKIAPEKLEILLKLKALTSYSGRANSRHMNFLLAYVTRITYNSGTLHSCAGTSAADHRFRRRAPGSISKLM
jgi:hypothetical protein